MVHLVLYCTGNENETRNSIALFEISYHQKEVCYGFF